MTFGGGMVTSRAMEVPGNMKSAKEQNSGPEQIPADTIGMTRREAARRLLGVVSAGAFLQFGTVDHPIWKHLANDSLLHKVEAAGSAAATRFLNAQQYSSLVAIAETIVPGSTKAHVAEFVDLLLGVDAEKNQTEFLESLKLVESECHTKFSKAFSALTESQKSELLARMEEKPAFKNLKTWVSGAYYSSEIGMRELGWTPNRFFPQFPGCEHSGDHASD